MDRVVGRGVQHICVRLLLHGVMAGVLNGFGGVGITDGVGWNGEMMLAMLLAGVPIVTDKSAEGPGGWCRGYGEVAAGSTGITSASEVVETDTASLGPTGKVFPFSPEDAADTTAGPPLRV